MSVFEGFKFRHVSSPIHRRDPRVKFLFVLVMFIAAVMFYELLVLIVLFFIPIAFVFLAGVQGQWLRSLKGAMFLATFLFVFNLIF